MQKVSEIKSVNAPISNFVKSLKIPKNLKRMHTHRLSKKFNPQEYDKCRENLLNFLSSIEKMEEDKFPNLNELQKEYKVEFEEFPRNGEVMGIFDAIYRRLFFIFFQFF